MRDYIQSVVARVVYRKSQAMADSFRLGYRADIEGLRALAILLVVAAHAGVPGLAGGFIGVDIFFVLSGYLITGLLIQELQSTGKVQLWHFYARRLRRLLPALLFMIMGTVLLSMMFLAPIEQIDHVASARIASVWMSNMFFAFSNLDYFAPAADKNLFLHTWSLGVEEQFYLVWPILLLFLLGTWSWQQEVQNFKRLFSGMVAIVGICLLLSIFLSYTKPLWGFYLMPSRAWQFALGALVLLWTNKNKARISCHNDLEVSPGITKIIALGGWVGITLILVAATLLDANVSYPGSWALMPSVGTGLLLIAGSTSTVTGLTRMLSIAPMQAIGRISYSWYLWHWSVLILGGIVVAMDKPAHRLALVGISLVLAVFSYGFVESPIRRNRLLTRRPGLTLAGSIVLMMSAVAVTSGWQAWAATWSASAEQQRYQNIRSDLPVIYAMGCDEWFYSAQVRVCAFGDKEATQTAVLIGDSIMGQWFPAIAAVYNKPGWRLLVMTKSACPMVDEPIFYARIGMEYTVCSRWRNDVLAALGSMKPDVVFIGGASSYDFNKSQWISGTERVMDKVASVAKEVFIIQGTQSLPFDGPSCLARQKWQQAFFSEQGDSCSAPVDSRREATVYVWLTQAVNGFDNVEILDMNPIICPGGRCYAESEGKIIFRDSQHLSAAYVETISDELARKIAGVKDNAL